MVQVCGSEVRRRWVERCQDAGVDEAVAVVRVCWETGVHW